MLGCLGYAARDISLASVLNIKLSEIFARVE